MLEARRRVRPLLQPRSGTLPVAAPAASTAATARNGQPTDVMLQGFHWDSHNSQNPNWYQIIAQNAGVIKSGRFDLVWFPPPFSAAFR